MNDHDFNTEKFKLPFEYKKNRENFFLILERLKISNLNEIQKVDLFFTLQIICPENIWMSYLIDIFDSINISHQINILQFCAFILQNDSNIVFCENEYIKKIESLKHDEERLFEFCFFGNFFKPVMRSSLFLMKRFNSTILEKILEICINIFSSHEKWLFCVERLSQIRELTVVELERIESIFKTNEKLRGKCLDIFINQNQKDFIKNSYAYICYLNHNNNENTPTTMTNNVHYYELCDNFLDNLSKFNTTENLHTCVEELIITGRLDDGNTYENILRFVKELFIGNYKYKNIEQMTIFTYCWSSLQNDDQKLSMAREIANFEENATCCYGQIINLLNLFGALTNVTILKINDDFAKRDERLKELHRMYSNDDPLWLDVDRIATLLTIDKED